MIGVRRHIWVFFPLVIFTIAQAGYGQIVVSPNVNIVSSDSNFQKQLEVSAATNPLNPSHVFAGFIDYETISSGETFAELKLELQREKEKVAAAKAEDPDEVKERKGKQGEEEAEREEAEDEYEIEVSPNGPISRARCGYSISFNGGKTWKNALVPLPPNGDSCGDPAVTWDTLGHAYYFMQVKLNDGITTNMYTARFTDLDNAKGGFVHDLMVLVDSGTSSVGQLLDKGAIAFIPDATPGGSLLAPGKFVVCNTIFDGQQNNIRTKVNCAASTDGGRTYTKPQQGKYNGTINSFNGVTVAPGIAEGFVLCARAFATGEYGIYCQSVDRNLVATDPVRVVGGAGVYFADFPTLQDNPSTPVDEALARSNSFPALASSINPANGNLNLVLAFQAYSDPFGQMAPPGPTSSTRIFYMTSTNGGGTWSQPRILDPGPHAYTNQFMPAVSSVAGVFGFTYYDGRNDGCYDQEPATPTQCGRPLNSTPSGWFPTGKDRRFDVRYVQGQFDGSGQFTVGSSVQLTNYDKSAINKQIVKRQSNCNSPACASLNWTNMIVGGGGTVSWMGDYHSLTPKVWLVRNAPSATQPAWRFANQIGDPVVFHAFWMDFRNVAFPETLAGPNINGDWTQWLPSGVCINPRIRDVQVMSAVITNNDLLASIKATPVRVNQGNGAPVVPPEFTVSVQSERDLFVRLTILDTATEDWSFSQTLPSMAADPADLNVVDLKIVKNSSLTATVYYRIRTSIPTPTRPVIVKVEEISGIGGSLVPGGSSTSATYYSTSSTAPLGGAAHGVSLTDPVVTTFDSVTSQPSNSKLDNSKLDNSKLDNSKLDNSKLDNSLVPDLQVTYTVTGGGALTTAATAFSNVVNGQELLQSGWQFQLLIYQSQSNPNVFQCTYNPTWTDVILSNIAITTPNASPTENFQVSNSKLDNSKLDNSKLDNSPVSEQIRNATFSVDSGEEVNVTLRAYKPNGAVASMKFDFEPAAKTESGPAETGESRAFTAFVPNYNPNDPNQIGQAIFGQAQDPVTGADVSAFFDTTPPIVTPVVSPAPNANGWNNTVPVTVSWTVTDAQSGVPANLQIGCSDAQVTTETAGTTFTCTATNGKGLTTTASVTVKIDTTPPVLSVAATVTGGATYVAGTWSNKDVTVTFSCVDNPASIASGVAAGNPIGTRTLTADTAGETVNGSCADNAGNSATASFGPVKIDKTPPTLTVSATANGTAYTAGTWTNQNVTVTFACVDNPAATASGVAPGSPTGSTTLTADTTGTNVNGSCTDNAGNISTLSFGPVKIDKTPPVITITVPANNGTYLLNSTTAANYGCTDAASGVATCTGPVANGSNLNTSTVGSKTFTVNASDVAGNSATATSNYAIVYNFIPGTAKITANLGSSVPLTWQLKDANGATISDLTSLQLLQSVYNGPAPSGPGGCVASLTGTAETLFSQPSGATGGSSFRFAGGAFTLNWDSTTASTAPTITGKGCYTVKVTLKDGSAPKAMGTVELK